VDKGDNDPLHFLAYGTLGLQTLEGGIGKAALTILQSPQPPPTESILANRIKDLARLATDCALAARNWVKERKLDVDDDIQSLRELEYLAFAHILVVEKRLDDADGVLQRLIENAETCVQL
jgi:LuxR family maltose regulon positive regulatory protein